MACFGEYEIVTSSQAVSFASPDPAVIIAAPPGKRVLYGWLPNPQVTLLHGRPVQDGDAWEFTLRNSGGGSVSVEFAVSCAYLD